MLTPTPATALPLSKEAQALLRRHHVHLLGTGQPALLFCSGFNCSQDVWHYLTPALAAHHQLILFDQLGAAQADCLAYEPAKYATLWGYAQDVVAICQALQLREVVLVGHSSGAMVALLAAILAPEYVTNLVLLAVSPCYLNEPGYYGGFEHSDLLAILAEMHADYARWASTFATMLLGQHQAPALSHELVAYATQANPQLARRMVQLNFLGDFRPQLARVQVPTLLLQCTDDPAVPEEVNTYLLAHLPAATLVTLATTGHCPHLTAPTEVVAAIQCFLGSGDSARRT